MNGYLQRLVTRGLSDAGAAGVLPSARSASPIAEADQRVGMPGFEEFASVAEAAPAGAPDGSVVSVGATQPAVPPRIGAGGAGDGSVQRQAAGPGVAGALAPTKSAAGPRVVGGGGPAGQAPGDTRLSERPLTSSVRLDEPAVLPPATPRPGPQDQAAGLRQAGRSHTGEIAPEAGGAISWGAGEHAPPASLHDGHIGARRVARRGGAEVGLQLLEPAPRALAAPPSMLSPPDVAASAADAASGPQVVIGSVNVEVVRTAEQQTTRAAATGPLTAESVSVIGPLGGRGRANLRFRLRHR